MRAARGAGRRGGQRASVRAGLYGDVAVLRGLAAAARPGPRPAARAAWLSRVPAGPLLRAAARRALPAAARRPGAAARRDRQVLRPGRRRLPQVRGAPGRPGAGARAAAPSDPAAAGVPAAGGPAAAGPAADPAAGGRRARGGRRDPAADRQHRRPAGGVLRDRRDAGLAVRLRGDRHLGRAAFGRDRVRDAAPSHRRDRRAVRHLGVPARRHGRGVGGAGAGRPDGRRPAAYRGRGGAHPDPRRPGGRGHPGREGRRGGGWGVDRRAGGRDHRAPADLVPAAARPGGTARRVRSRHPRLAQPQRDREDQPGAGPAAGVRRVPGAGPVGLRRHDRAGRIAR